MQPSKTGGRRFTWSLRAPVLLIWVTSDVTIPLSSGDALVLPHGTAHIVRGPSTPANARGPFDIHSRPFGSIKLTSNTDLDPETRFICGRLRFVSAHDNLVLAALPDAIVVSAADDSANASRLRTLMSWIREELESPHAGTEAIVTDLASALFVMVVRIHLSREGPECGLLALLAHRQLGRAVAVMVDDPARNWTLDELATCANASRASLVRMFRETTQRSPVAFLTELRLDLARRKLSGTTQSVAAIAGDIGYASESAFSRAFHRQFGIRPGEARGRALRSPRCASTPTDDPSPPNALLRGDGENVAGSRRALPVRSLPADGPGRSAAHPGR